MIGERPGSPVPVIYIIKMSFKKPAYPGRFFLCPNINTTIVVGFFAKILSSIWKEKPSGVRSEIEYTGNKA